MTFTVEIELGNDAMQTGEDLAHALRGVAAKIEDCSRPVEDWPASVRTGPIRDVNGNTVGRWKAR